MRSFATIDYVIIALYSLATLYIGNFFFKRASKSVNEYFLSNRSMSWFLLGTSMAATNYSIDTPLAIAKFVAKYGLSGSWFIWSAGIATVSATFLFSRLWRRARVMTDNELIELRYSGNVAAVLRFVKGIYFGLLINSFVLGWVFNGLIKVSVTLTPFNAWTVLAVFGVITMIYTIGGGYYGVIWTDLIEYVFCIVGAGALTLYAIHHVGGVHSLISQLNVLHPDKGFVDLVPSFSKTDQSMAFSSFFILITIKWWSHKYSDGGGKHIQRMSSAKNEVHAVFGTFFFSCFTSIIALWPLVLCGLCAAALFPTLKDPEVGYPMLMQTVLPSGMFGLAVVGLLAAFMSTVTTHLNLGASYFVNDMYRRFMAKEKTEKHYVIVSRIATAVVMMIGMAIGLNIKSVADTYLFVLTLASGAGLIWILRWFWWRINAYSEISAMIVSGIVASYLKIRYGLDMEFTTAILIIIGITTPIVLAVTYLTDPVGEEKLKSFYLRVQPSLLGWRWLVKKHNLPYASYFKRALPNFVLGVALLFCSNLGFGVLVLKSVFWGVVMLAMSVVLTVVLIKRVLAETTISE